MVSQIIDKRGDIHDVTQFTGEIPIDLLNFDPLKCYTDQGNRIEIGDYIVRSVNGYKAVSAGSVACVLPPVDDRVTATLRARLFKQAYFFERYERAANVVDSVHEELRQTLMVVTLFDDLREIQASVNERLEKVYSGFAGPIELIEREGWRIVAWENRSSRELYPIKNTVVLTCLNVTEGMPDSIVTPLRGMLSDPESAKLYKGNTRHKNIIELLEPRYAIVSVGAPEGEELIDRLLSLIPIYSEDSYSQNAYEAALEVFKSLHGDFDAEMDNKAKFIASTYSQEENINAIVARMGLGEFFANKVEAWKDLNITPTAAKVKLLANKELSEKEINSILNSIQHTQKNSNLIFGNRYAMDVTQRAYVESVKEENLRKARYAGGTQQHLQSTQQKANQNQNQGQVRTRKRGSYKPLAVGAVLLCLALLFDLGPGLLIISAVILAIGFVVGPFGGK
jgi:hypothetical protein